jgi:DNA-binding winged helix-turn-helix (wHTH) protein
MNEPDGTFGDPGSGASYAKVAPKLLRIGECILDLSSGELERAGTRTLLPEQPFRVLELLAMHPREVVTRETLKARLWPRNTFVDFDTGLNAAVRKLRAALGDDAGAPRYIETLPKRGYRCIASVEAMAAPEPVAASVSGEAGPAAAVSATPSDATDATVASLPEQDRWRDRLRAWRAAGKLIYALTPEEATTDRPEWLEVLLGHAIATGEYDRAIEFAATRSNRDGKWTRTI